MSRVDQFESIFRSADKAVYRYQKLSVGQVLVVTDLDNDESTALCRQIRDFLGSIDGGGTAWSVLAGDEFTDVGALLDAVERRKPELVVTYRHLHSDAWKWPHSLGEYLDVLTQVAGMPILVMPHPDASHALPHSMTNTDQVMVVTDHLTGDGRLVDHALAFTDPGGTCWLTHIESQRNSERWQALIEKIPEIDSEPAVELLREKMLKEPADYIESCRRAITDAGADVKIKAHVAMGHRIEEYRKLIENNEIDLLVMNTMDESQSAMDSLAYPLAIELRQIPLLMV